MATATRGQTALAPYHDRAAWLAERNPKIGASDVIAVLGRDEYDPAGQKVWDRIVLGLVEENLEEKSGDIRRGRKFEEIAADTFAERFGVTLRRHPMKTHRELPFLVANVDRLIVSMTPEQWAESGMAMLGDHQEGPGACEVKVPRVSNFYRFKEEGLPLSHVVQHQAQMAVTGWKWGVFAFYTPEYDDVIAFLVIRDDEFIGLMERRLALWWENHVEGEIRPDRPVPALPRWPMRPKGEAEQRDDPEWTAAAEYYREAEYLTEQARMRAEAAQENLLALFGEEDQHLAGAGVVVKRYSTTSQRRFDAKAFKAAVLLAQKNGDTDALMSLDPDADEYHYQTNSSEKIDIKITAPREDQG